MGIEEIILKEDRDKMMEEVVYWFSYERQVGDSLVLAITNGEERLLFTAKKRGDMGVYLLDNKEYAQWELTKYNLESGDEDYHYITKIKDIEGTGEYRDGGFVLKGRSEDLAKAIIDEAKGLFNEDLSQYRKEEENVFSIETRGVSGKKLKEVLEKLALEIINKGAYEVKVKHVHHKPEDERISK